ncbi:MAG: protein kinase family protein, partial [Planctomycetes bacterium]|nr:protein kinase family protein [Planctomycetota bacterium]
MASYLPQQLAGRWQLLSAIGSGTQGETYVIKRTTSGHDDEAVLKVRKDSDGTSVARFTRELAVLRQISHPNVIGILESDDSGSPEWFIMPRGTQFERWWKNKRDQLGDDPARLFRCSADVVLGLLGGLCELHNSGYTHRDVKPSNVVVIDDRPVLIDLGIVHHAELEGLTDPNGAGNRFVTVSRSIPPSPKLDNLCLASLWINML